MLDFEIFLFRILASQDGRAVQGAAFRSQSTSVGVGSNPTSDKKFLAGEKKIP